MLTASKVSTAKIWSAATGERTPRSGALHAHGLYGEYCQGLERCHERAHATIWTSFMLVASTVSTAKI